MPGVSNSTCVTPGTGLVDRNQTVAMTTANAPQPAQGKNSFTQNEARGHLESNGFQNVNSLRKDEDDVWRGTAMKNGQSAQVWLDYKGNTGSDLGMSNGGNLPGWQRCQPGHRSGVGNQDDNFRRQRQCYRHAPTGPRQAQAYPYKAEGTRTCPCRQ